MTYTPAQISASYGGDVFVIDYAHADSAQVYNFGGGSWNPYLADNVTISDTITPAQDASGMSQAGNIKFSVTLHHLDTFASSHLEFDGSNITVDYTIDGGKTWTIITAATTIALDPATNPDFDVRVSFAGGTQNDPAVLNSVTVYVLTSGSITAQSGSRALSFGKDVISDSGLVCTGDTISAATDAITIGSIEIMAAVGQLNMTIFNGSASSLAIDANGVPTATGCTAYVNGNPLSATPNLVVSTHPYHFVIVPTTAVNEQFTLGAGLTISDLALYQAALSSTDAFNLYSAQVNGMPTIIVNDSAVMTVTERSPAAEFFAYAWSIVSSGSQ